MRGEGERESEPTADQTMSEGDFDQRCEALSAEKQTESARVGPARGSFHLASARRQDVEGGLDNLELGLGDGGLQPALEDREGAVDDEGDEDGILVGDGT